MVGLYQFLKKYGVAIGFGLGAVLVVLMYLLIFSNYPEGNPTSKELGANHSEIFNFGIYISYFLIILATILSLVFPIGYLAMNIKESIKVLVGIAAIVVIFFIAYSIGSGEISGEIAASIAKGKVAEMTEGEMKLAEGLMYMGYIMLGLTGLVALAANARDFSKQ